MSMKRPPKENEGTSTPTDEHATTNEPSYEVGYKRPPVSTRFKPGVSGNPSGRPRRIKVRNIGRDILESFLEPVRMNDGNTVRRVPGIVALQKKILNDALKGDRASAKFAYQIAEKFGVLGFQDKEELDLSLLSEEERALCRKVIDLLYKARRIVKEDT
jgi:hypothetical protein